MIKHIKCYVCYFHSYNEGVTTPQRVFWHKADAQKWIADNFDEDNEAKFKEIDIEGCSLEEFNRSITNIARKILEKALNNLK